MPISPEVPKAYLEHGLCVLPALDKDKRPNCWGWKKYQEEKPTDQEIHNWFVARQANRLCIICGKVSGNLELLDFDAGGEKYEEWKAIVEERAPGLIDSLVIESSPSGGKHVVFRCQTPVDGNTKLASRVVVGEDGKKKAVCLIETRGEGGLFLCYPSPDYVLEQGKFTEVPIVTTGEREIMMEAARSLDEPEEVQGPAVAKVPPVNMALPPCASIPSGSWDERPGDDFCKRGDIRPYLSAHGWERCGGPVDNEYWKRPGKDEDGCSATLKDAVFYVHSTSAYPFEARGYSIWHVYAILEHGGDFGRAAMALAELGFGTKAELPEIDISGIMSRMGEEKDEHEPIVPIDLLRVPGLISQIMDISLNTAPYPNQVLAFSGALAFMSLLGGRVVCDSHDTRTNIYVVGLAFSGAGKEQPRQVNLELARQLGILPCIGDKFASSEGLQDALTATPRMLFQTDEVDSLLNSMNGRGEVRWEMLQSTLMTIFTSSNGPYPLRRTATRGSKGEIITVIQEPSLSIFGTAIPKYYYAAISDKQRDNGFVSRTLILDATKRGTGQDKKPILIPDHILETAKHWVDLAGIGGNLVEHVPSIKPNLVTVHTDKAGNDVSLELRELCESQYDNAYHLQDDALATIWSRVHENASKLALIYAISESKDNPLISTKAWSWARDLTLAIANRMIFMAGIHSGRSEFSLLCDKVLGTIRCAGGAIGRRDLFRKIRSHNKRQLDEVIDTLKESGQIQECSTKTKGRPNIAYRAY